jgi:hypothetical protein
MWHGGAHLHVSAGFADDAKAQALVEPLGGIDPQDLERHRQTGLMRLPDQLGENDRPQAATAPRRQQLDVCYDQLVRARFHRDGTDILSFDDDHVIAMRVEALAEPGGLEPIIPAPHLLHVGTKPRDAHGGDERRITSSGGTKGIAPSVRGLIAYQRRLPDG